MLLVAMPGAPSSDALAPSSVLVPSNARSYVRSVLATFVANLVSSENAPGSDARSP